MADQEITGRGALGTSPDAGDILFVRDISDLTDGPGGTDKRVTFTNLTLNLLSTTLTDSNIFVGNGSNVATDVSVSGEASLANTGALTLDNDSVIAKTLTGFTSTSGTITAADTLLSAIEKLDGNTPNAVEDNLTVTINGQTAFTLSATPSADAAFALYLNGQLRLRGTDYTQVGTALTWLDPGGVTLETTDELLARYNNTAASILSLWSDDGTDLTPATAGRNVDFGTGILKDNDATVGVALADATDNTLNTTSQSLIGAINEVDNTWQRSGTDLTPTNAGDDTNFGTGALKDNDVVTAVALGDGSNTTFDTTNQTILGAVNEVNTKANTVTMFFPVQLSGDNGDYRIRTISATGAFNFSFMVPADFVSLDSIEAIFSPTAGAAGAGKDIDLNSEYAAVGEATNTHSESDTGTVYDFTGLSGQWAALDLSPVFTSLSAGDFAGVEIDHNSIGGGMDYLGIRLVYTKS